MVIKQLTKEKYYILCTIDNNDIMAEVIVYLLLENV